MKTMSGLPGQVGIVYVADGITIDLQYNTCQQLPALHIGQTLPEGYRIYDAQGRELPALQPGLNLIHHRGQLLRKLHLSR